MNPPGVSQVRLQVDWSFFRGLTSTGESAEPISSVVRLGKTLGLSVVVEGVSGWGYLFRPAVAL
jgi:EAL domain-containing protein (putative c-di-GMP-specific phosphodiesterase class I)